MTKKIVFATNNRHKLEEVKNILGKKIEIISLQDIGCEEEIPETADTLEGNAELKAQYISQKYNIDCFADDTGLEIAALNGKPGVFSARYAGEPSNSANNVRKVLYEMQGKENREAQFRTVICLVENGKSHFFEGKITGKIAQKPTGGNGFGYDPVFIPDGYNKSFAELTTEDKNRISHRALAVKELAVHFDNNNR
ncbi:Non-canonical purine NTP pyrophosphatase [uncultured Paludibacter sp.]|nr:Non-canonical purine NTP pyrophosphatase [uncultured Paludibacter sp.]